MICISISPVCDGIQQARVHNVDPDEASLSLLVIMRITHHELHPSVAWQARAASTTTISCYPSTNAFCLRTAHEFDYKTG
jgi:hypothetical protein